MIRHLSLRGWLRWIHASACDAVLRVRTPDGGSGTIWCSTGKVVDAEWGQLTRQAALKEMLGLPSGAVTIDFEPNGRPARSSKPPLEPQPILEGQSEPPQSHALSDAAPLDPAFGQSLSLPTRETSPAPYLSRMRRQAGRISRSEYLAATLLLSALALGAFAFGRLRASSESDSGLVVEAAPAQQTKSGLLPPPAQPDEPAANPDAPSPRELPVISFAAIEVEPASAEVWLDHSLVGVGRIELAPIPDGALHELRFVADGHVPRSLFFVDAPPAGRVLLERTPKVPAAGNPLESPKPDAPAIEAARAEPSANEADTAHEPVRRAPRRRAAAPVAAPAPAAQRPRPVAETPAPAKPIELKKSPQVQVIDARTPRVQVVE